VGRSAVLSHRKRPSHAIRRDEPATTFLPVYVFKDYFLRHHSAHPAYFLKACRILSRDFTLDFTRMDNSHVSELGDRLQIRVYPSVLARL
jgi:hypothetical protein